MKREPLQCALFYCERVNAGPCCHDCCKAAACPEKCSNNPRKCGYAGEYVKSAGRERIRPAPNWHHGTIEPEEFAARRTSKTTGELALRCLACGNIDVVDSRRQDGNTCSICQGHAYPAGYLLPRVPKGGAI